jgi:hypothetical protein
MIYLASPYSVGKDGAYGEADTGKASKNMKTRRYKLACKKAAELMIKYKQVVFSPIAHSHSIEIEGMNGEIQSGDFWLEQDLDILKRCDGMYVYRLPGWDQSRGIAREISRAEALGIPIEYVD